VDVAANAMFTATRRPSSRPRTDAHRLIASLPCRGRSELHHRAWRTPADRR
jgi:hypothetical protein